MSLGAVLGVLAVLIVPGLPASLLVAPPGKLDPVTRLAIVLPLGAVVAGAVAFLLTLGGLLSAPAFVAGAGISSVAMGLTVARRHGVRQHLRADAARLRADPWPVVLGLVVLAGIAVVRWTWDPRVHFTAASAWRYWADGLEIADHGGIPSASLQYGMDLVPTVSKAFLNALNAGFSLVIGREALPALGALLWVGSVGLAGVAWALGRELGLRWTGPLVALFLVANRTFLNPEITTDLDAYRAETFGRLVAFGGLVLAIHALREHRGWSVAVASGVTLGAAAGMHVVPVIVAALIAGLYGLALILRDRERRAVLLRGLAVAGVGGVVALALFVLPKGDVGLAGASGGDDVYARFGGDFDPTLFIAAGTTPEQQAADGPRDWTLTPGRAYRAFVASALGRPGTEGLNPHAPPGWLGPAGVLLAFGLVGLAVAMLVWFPPALRPLGVVAAGLALFLVGLAWWFSRRSSLYIPANFGLRRLYDYSAVPLLLVALGLCEAGTGPLGRVNRRAPVAAAAAVVALAGVLLLPSARMRPERVDRVAPMVEAMRWADEHLPCRSLILANQHTEGFFEAGLGRPGLLEGATPYLRPQVLETTIGLILEARAFFTHPALAALPDARVTHVMVIRGGGIGYSAGLGKIDITGLDAARFLKLVHSNDAVRIYELTGAAAGDGIDAGAYPGYSCAA